MNAIRRRLAAAVVAAMMLSGCTFNGVYDLPIPGSTVSKGDGFEISADFADALNLVPRSSVMVGDVEVGQVESVTRSGWNARVTMLVRHDVKLPDNAEAQIRQTSLLGEKFVSLEAPLDGKASSGRLGAGDVIPIARTGRNPEVEEVLGALSLVLTGGGVGQIQSITRELNDMMDGRTGKLRNVLGEVNTLVGTLNSQRGDIVQALDGINGLSATLVAEKKTIGNALDAAGPAITVLRKQHTQLVKMLSELDKLGVVGTRVVNSTKDDLIAELRHLEPVLRTLADTDEALIPGLSAAASYPFPIDAGDAIRGDYANVAFLLQINLTPVSEGGLLPTTLEDVVSLCRATPLAPICSPAGDAIEQLCSVLKSTPLCRDSDVAEVEAALARAGGAGQPDGSATPTEPTPSKTGPDNPKGGGDGDDGGGQTGLGSGLVDLIDGLLKGLS